MKFIWVSVKMSSNSAWLVRGHIQQGGAATSEVCQGAWGLEVPADYLWWGGHGRGNTRGAGVEVADGRVTSREAIMDFMEANNRLPSEFMDSETGGSTSRNLWMLDFWSLSE